jgi:O-antigen/teichoic acid export membrane protein
VYGAVFKRYVNSDSTRHALALGLGTALGQLAVTLASPIWSRLYEPAQFGKYGLMVSYLSAATAAISFRYDMAIPLARNPDESIRLVLLALFCAIPMSLLSGGVFFWLTYHGVFGFGRLPPWSAVFVIASIALTSCYSTLRFWHVRNSDFSAIGASMVTQGIGRALTPIALAPFNLGWLGLLGGELLGRTLGIRKLARPLLPLVGRIAKNTSTRHFGRLIRRYRQYPLVFLPSSILDAASGAAPLPVVVALYGVTTGGEFLLAQQIVIAPAAFICGSLRDVIHSRLIRCAQGDPAELSKFLGRTALRLFLLASAAYLPLACLAPYLAIPIFGHSWPRVGSFVAILCPAAVFTVAVSPISRAMVLSRIPQIKFAADLAKLLLPVGGLIVGTKLGDHSITVALIWFAVMTAVSYTAYYAIVMFSIRVDKRLPFDRPRTRITASSPDLP